MVLFLLALQACEPAPGHDTDAYSACVRFGQIACECGNTDVDANDPEWFCRQGNVDGICWAYDLRYCDTSSDQFDADVCEAVHDIDEEAAQEFYNCVNRVYADECTDWSSECGDRIE